MFSANFCACASTCGDMTALHKSLCRYWARHDLDSHNSLAHMVEHTKSGCFTCVNPRLRLSVASSPSCAQHSSGVACAAALAWISRLLCWLRALRAAEAPLQVAQLASHAAAQAARVQGLVRCCHPRVRTAAPTERLLPLVLPRLYQPRRRSMTPEYWRTSSTSECFRSLRW